MVSPEMMTGSWLVQGYNEAPSISECMHNSDAAFLVPSTSKRFVHAAPQREKANGVGKCTNDASRGSFLCVDCIYKHMIRYSMRNSCSSSSSESSEGNNWRFQPVAGSFTRTYFDAIAFALANSSAFVKLSFGDTLSSI